MGPFERPILTLILGIVIGAVVVLVISYFRGANNQKKANKLIEQVSSAIDLELKNGSGASVSDVPIENVETYQLKDGDKPQRFNCSQFYPCRNNFFLFALAGLSPFLFL